MLQYLKYSDGDSIICVGHSAFFKAFVSKNLHPNLESTRPDLFHKMCKYKLHNGACLAVTVDYTLPNSSPKIVDASLMFDSTFAEPKKKKDKSTKSRSNSVMSVVSDDEDDSDDDEAPNRSAVSSSTVRNPLQE